MKIFAVRDMNDSTNKDIAYLIYYEKAKRFYIELPDDADPWETPLLLSSFLKRGERTVNSYWSRLWVQQRVIPQDRQNLGHILKDNGLKDYDEFDLLVLANGRCAQDDYYLSAISENDLPKSFAARQLRKVEDVVPLSGKNLLVFFRDGTIKKCALSACLSKDKTFAPLLQNDKMFRTVSIQSGGYGVCWGERLNISDDTLYNNGEDIPLSLEDFHSFVENRIVNSAEAAAIMECSRQNISDLVRRGKLHPIKSTPKNMLFLESEITQREWQ